MCGFRPCHEFSIQGSYSSNRMRRSILRGWNKNWRCVLNQSGQSRELRNLVAHGEIYLDILDRKRMISKRNLVMVYDCPLQQAVKKTVRD